MSSIDTHTPFDQAEALLAEEPTAELGPQLEELPMVDAARAFARLEEGQQRRVLEVLEPELAAELVDCIPDVQAAGLVEHLEPQVAAAIVQELPSDEQADLLGDLPAQDAEAILSAMEPDAAAEARQLAGYADDVAGGLMITEHLQYLRTLTVGDVIADLQANADEYRDYDIQYAYVVDEADVLCGVLRMRDLLLARRSTPIHEISIGGPVSIRDDASLDDVCDLFDTYAFFGVPVVNEAAQLVGVIQRAAVEEALADQADATYRQSQGIIGGEELRTMPLLLRSRRRLAWLSINVVLNIAAASVIAMYQDTLAAVIALAVFLPIISDMSGCSGSQAVAVSIRELSLGLVQPNELLRVWLKEISVGALNGLVIGLLIAGVAVLWKGSPLLGLVVGLAMAINTVVAVSIGGAVPLVLRWFKFDPALASGPILTTVTDMCGFFLVLSLATAILV